MNEETIDTHLRQALQYYNMEDWPGALREVNKVLRENPDYFRALYALSNIARRAGSLGIALLAARRCVELNGENPQALNALGQCLDRVGSEVDAFTAFKRSLDILPNATTAMHIANLYANRGSPETALTWYAKARTMPGADGHDDGDFAQNEAFAHLALRQWPEGWEKMRHSVGRSHHRKDRKYHDAEMWSGQETDSLVIWGDQGIGDEIMFASCIADAAKLAKRVIIDTEPKLAGLFKRSFPDAEVHGTLPNDAPPWLVGSGPLSHRCIISQLPQFFRLKDADFPAEPYLVADPDRCRMVKALLNGVRPVNPRRPKIGIAWTGGMIDTGRDRRSLPAANLSNIVRALPGVDWFSLQYMPAPEASAHGIHHYPFLTETGDMDDVAALISELDAVVSVQTAVVHVAGALGKPCFVLVNSRPAWRYGAKGSSMPWYGSVELFRQEGGDWSAPTRLMLERLKERLPQWAR